MQRHFAPLLTLLLCLLLGACATQHQAPGPVDALLRDSAFGTPPPAFEPRTLFELSPAMQVYAQQKIPPRAAGRDPRRVLIEALYSSDQLKLDYDGATTRTAAEAFEARAGNCLSLVIMTAAFAKHLGLEVNYRSAIIDEMYRRSGDLYMSSGHVNLIIGPPPPRGTRYDAFDSALVVDFLSRDELRHLRTVPLGERTVIAMYLNNRAAEALGEGQGAQAYWWARAAVLQDPGFAAAANTLGVVYRRAGLLGAAEDALRRALMLEPNHTAALSNLAGLLAATGRTAEARAVEAQLAELQPVRPFHYFDLGRQAMAAGDYAAASRYFARELRHQPLQDEVHFWAALAAWRLGDNERAAHHMGRAMEYSETRSDHARYATKLDHLRAQASH